MTLDFYDGEGAGSPQHYAFMVGEEEFDQIFGRIQAGGVAFWADPGHRLRGRRRLSRDHLVVVSDRHVSVYYDRQYVDIL